MYVASQITPLEWRKAAVCHRDDDIVSDDNEFHSCKNSLYSINGHERLMRTTEIDGRGNCSENYSTYLKNASEMSEESDAWMSMEHRRNFLERQHLRQHQKAEFGSPRHYDDNLDINDDGLIGCGDAGRDSFLTFDNDDTQSIELVSYENNFNLKNSFSWALGTLIQTTSDLYPKVSLGSCFVIRNVDGYDGSVCQLPTLLVYRSKRCSRSFA